MVAIPETMQAAVYLERRKLAVEERPVPRLDPDEVLVRVSHCGVCGTDLHLVMEGWGRPRSIGGHEYKKLHVSQLLGGPPKRLRSHS